MQNLSGSPREHLTPEQVRKLLTDDAVTVTAGCEILDQQNRVVTDISDDLAGGEIDRDNYATVHGSCRLQLARELAWGKDRVRPYMLLRNGDRYLRPESTATTVVTNWIPNPSFENGAVGWNSAGIPSTDMAAVGSWALKIAGTATWYTVDTDPFSIELFKTGAVYQFKIFSVSASRIVRLEWWSYDAAGVLVSVFSSPEETTTVGGWKQFAFAYPDAMFNKNIRSLELRLVFSAIPAGEAHYVDAAMLEFTDTPESPTPYFDGDTPADGIYDYSWTGTPHNSPSVKQRYVTTYTERDLEARFNLGAYVLTTPTTERAEAPTTYSVTGYDLLHLLQDGPGDTHTVDIVAAPGVTYIQAVRDAITASGIGAPVLLDGTAQATALPATMVWAITSDGPSWLAIINDLLAGIAYTGIYADENGALRSRPQVDTSIRPAEWTLDTSDPATDLVAEDRSLTEDVWGAPNWWRFVRTGMATTPVEGDGIYTVENVSDGITSQDALGRTVRKPVQFLDAADENALVAQGDQIVASDRAVVTTFDLNIEPLPIMGHRDVFQLIDAARIDKVEAAAWSLSLDGTPGRLALGGARATSKEPMSVQATATVTSAAPLRVVVDGATVDSLANALDAATYAIGNRVTVTVRNPLPPLIQGVEA